jgi:hypothetical protein
MSRGASRWAAACLLLAGLEADAQFTSSYAHVNVAANFNGFETFAPNMILISNGVWQGYFTLSQYAEPRFLFAVSNFTTTWKETNQSSTALPLSGTAELNAGSDIAISGEITGTLRFRFDERTRDYTVVDVTTGSPPGEVWINEIHYDNIGTDSNEFVEVVGVAGTSLSDYSLILYNGAVPGNATPYNTRVLSGTIPSQVNGFGAVSFAYPANGIQNGDPDAVALVKNGTNALLFLSYEGTCTAGSGPAQGMTSFDIGVREAGDTTADFSLQLRGVGPGYGSFSWSDATNGSPGQINAQQTPRAGVPAGSVAVANLIHSPLAPGTNDTVHIQADVQPQVGATNIFATAFYRIGTNGLFSPISMTAVSGSLYRTTSPIPAQPGGTRVLYYVFVSFDASGTSSPVAYPAGAPDVFREYGISAIPPGTVWINEMNAAPYGFEDDTNEFVEIAGRAGTDVSGWKLQIFGASQTPNATYALPRGTILPNRDRGFGFYVIGDAGVPRVNMVLTNIPSGTSHLPNAGALRLLNEFGSIQYGLTYGYIPPTNFPGHQYVGGEDDFDFGEQVLALRGTGGVYSAFAWVTNATATPGLVNAAQGLTGGNTNPLAPIIFCPSNVYLDCIAAGIPPPNISSVSATGLCGNQSVTVTHAGDATNSGTGCRGNPRIVSRTYRAVSACATTSTCTQLFIVEDKEPPVVDCGDTPLPDAGFESGGFTVWSNFGNAAGNVSISSASPRSGDFSARVATPFGDTAFDSGPNGFDGKFFGNPLRQQTSPTTNLVKSVRFDGTDDRIDVPYEDALNPPGFGFAVWVRVLGGQNTYRSAVTSRDPATFRGYSLYAGVDNKWQFWTGTGSAWDPLVGPPVVLGQWLHIVCSYDNAAQRKTIFINGSSYASITNVTALPQTVQPYPLRIGAGASEGPPTFFFNGLIDDVQFYGRPLVTADATNLYNRGSGNVEAAGLVARYRMDEANLSGAFTAGVEQAVSASAGQTWSAALYAQIPATDPLVLGNSAHVELEYLDGAGAVLASFASPSLTAATAPGPYQRLVASGTAPAGTARLRVRGLYDQQVGGGGLVNFDDALLSRYLIDLGAECQAVLPDFRPSASASDNCGIQSIVQTPAPGGLVDVTTTQLVFVATDLCGSSSTCAVPLLVVDAVPPVVGCQDITVECSAALPLPSSNDVFVSECPPYTVTWLGDTDNGANGCPGNPRLIARSYLVTDFSGNSAGCTQRITQVASNAPALTCTGPGPLFNAGFESGTFSGWSVFGSGATVSTVLPRTGLRHARIAGPSNGQESFTGLYQDKAAGGGQTWRASAWFYTSPTNPISGDNRALVKIEFFDEAFALLNTIESAPFTYASSVAGRYAPVAVQGESPAGATLARIVVLYVQTNNAPGPIYVDDVDLSMTTLAATNDCLGLMPELRSLLQTGNLCSQLAVAQDPQSGIPVGRGTTLVRMTAIDECDLSSVCTSQVTFIDGIAPYITACPTDVQVASTNDIPPANTNAVAATDDCGGVQIQWAGDTGNGRSGAAGDPLVIVRRYHVSDPDGNVSECKQVITVEGAATTNIAIVGVTLGSNFVVKSTGGSTGMLPEYSTNLMALPQSWLPVPTYSNTYVNGTNYTTIYAPATNASPVLIRLRDP